MLGVFHPITIRIEFVSFYAAVPGSGFRGLGLEEEEGLELMDPSLEEFDL
jgi:hypothetical protein